MTTLSPEIVDSGAVRSVSAAGEKIALLPYSDSILMLARLGCLTHLLHSPQQFAVEFRTAVRTELVERLGSPGWRSKVCPWLSYRMFERTVCDDVTDFSRDVLSSRIILSRVSMEQLFSPEATWLGLVDAGRRDVQVALEAFNRDQNLAELLVSVYEAQRQQLVREYLVKVLPTLVLMISAAIAMIMAFFVWRSLGAGN